MKRGTSLSRIAHQVHSARATVQLFRRETPDFIALELWPLNSPETLSLWNKGSAAGQVNRQPLRDVDELMQRLIASSRL